jgi:hypothetical protein
MTQTRKWHWQDTINLILGIGFALSPWVVGYMDLGGATASAVVAGLLLAAGALGASLVPKAWEEWSEVLIGGWMVISPWVLGFTGTGAAASTAVIIGVVAIVLAAWRLVTDESFGWRRDAHAIR